MLLSIAYSKRCKKCSRCFGSGIPIRFLSNLVSISIAVLYLICEKDFSEQTTPDAAQRPSCGLLRSELSKTKHTESRKEEKIS
jgi:hypothetical protein